MSFDLRDKYPNLTDPSESQIAEGLVSTYGQQNSHANCVPSSFTAALTAAGYPDFDPEQIIVDEYGIDWRGGTQFWRSIEWIQARVPGVTFTNSEGTGTGFNFDTAEAAGQAGHLIVIAGWIDAPSVSFVAIGDARGFSHASLLIAHTDADEFVIWNVWLGKVQTYSRAVMAASLYEMAVMEVSDLSAADVQAIQDNITSQGNALSGKLAALSTFVTANFTSINGFENAISQRIAELRSAVDAGVLNDAAAKSELEQYLAHPATGIVDPGVKAELDALAAHLGIGVA